MQVFITSMVRFQVPVCHERRPEPGIRIEKKSRMRKHPALLILFNNFIKKQRVARACISGAEKADL